MRRYTYILIGISFVFLQACQRRQTYFAYYENSTIRVDEKIKAEDSTTLAMIRPYKVKLDEQMNEIIGYNSEELIKAKPGSNLTNWMADAMAESYERLAREKLDFVVANYGGIRINSVAGGDLTLGKLYEIMPFENALVVMDLNGDQVKLLLDRIAAYGGWPVSEGLNFEIADSTAINIMIQNKPWSATALYRIGLPDYIANGGDDCDFLKPLPRVNTGMLVRDLLINDVKRNKTLVPKREQRIKVKTT
ncbi:MAG: 5'-nucleotidase C-terminal domain-containing protein [Saprospiraceae bacterium]